MINTKKRKPRTPKGAVSVKSELKMPKEILPWEFELLTTVLKIVNETQDADSQQKAALQ